MKPIDATFCIGSAASLAVASTALGFLPGAPLVLTLCFLIASEVLVWQIFRRTAFASPIGMGLLLGAATISMFGVIINVNDFTFGGHLSEPLLHNFDMHRDWVNAWLLPDDASWREYSYWIIGVCAVFGRHIAVPLLFNSLFYVLTILATGAITYAATGSKKTSTIAMGIIMCMCYLLAQSAALLKDVPLTLLTACGCLIFLRWRSRLSRRDMILSFIAMMAVCYLLWLLRPNTLLMMMAGAVLLGFRLPVRKIKPVFVLAVLGIGIIYLSISVHSHYIPADKLIAVDKNILYDLSTPNTRAWDNMLDNNYEGLSVIHKLMLLPASTMVQFLIPFPWNFDRDTIFGPFTAVAHFGYFWYVAGALVLYFICALWRRSPVELRLMVVWGVIFTLITAYICSGRVSRYCLPYLPLLIPAAAYTVSIALHRRSLRIWLGVFAVAMAVVLVICHHLQTAASICA